MTMMMMINFERKYFQIVVAVRWMYKCYVTRIGGKYDGALWVFLFDCWIINCFTLQTQQVEKFLEDELSSRMPGFNMNEFQAELV